jgi:hypothetical protein
VAGVAPRAALPCGREEERCAPPLRGRQRVVLAGQEPVPGRVAIDRGAQEGRRRAQDGNVVDQQVQVARRVSLGGRLRKRVFVQCLSRRTKPFSLLVVRWGGSEDGRMSFQDKRHICPEWSEEDIVVEANHSPRLTTTSALPVYCLWDRFFGGPERCTGRDVRRGTSRNGERIFQIPENAAQRRLHTNVGIDRIAYIFVPASPLLLEGPQ